MADKCGATHPEHPELTCLLGYPHEEHTARGAEGLTHWPNEAWVRQTNPHQLMKDMSFESMHQRMPAQQVKRRGQGLARTTDPETSHEAGRKLTTRESQKAALLEHYLAAGPAGLTDDEAGIAAGLMESCYWRRCTDLRQDGSIAFNGETRIGPSAGARRNVSVHRNFL